MRLDGMTDRAIARALLAAEGNQAVALDQRMREVTEAEIDAVLVRYLEALAQQCARNAYEALPGAAALLQRLRARADVLLGLCTGNLARGAELKLTCAGLWADSASADMAATRSRGRTSSAPPGQARASWARPRRW